VDKLLQNYTTYIYGKCIWIRYCKYLLEKTVGAIKNGQSRKTGNIGHARHKTKTKTNKNTTQYVLDNTNTQTLVYDKGSDRHSDNRETYETYENEQYKIKSQYG
jgi:hypothetical protein